MPLSLHSDRLFPADPDTRAIAGRLCAGLPGLTLLSCDNLSGNGAQLELLMIANWL